jgi:hypothetical protein
MDLRKKILKLKCFSPLKVLTFPFYVAETRNFSFSFLSFFNTFSLSLFSMLRLFEDLGILIINEEKNTLKKFLFR